MRPVDGTDAGHQEDCQGCPVAGDGQLIGRAVVHGPG